MESMTVSKVAVAIMCMVALLCLSAPLAVEGITCGQVTSGIRPCVPYLRGGGGVPQNCCSAVQGLYGAAKSLADKKTACSCVKEAYGSIRGIKSELAAGLPGKCGVFLPYRISPNTDCSRVQ